MKILATDRVLEESDDCRMMYHGVGDVEVELICKNFFD